MNTTKAATQSKGKPELSLVSEFVRTEKPEEQNTTIKGTTGIFTSKPDGIYLAAYNRDGELLPEKQICSPLKVVARTRNQHQMEWGLLLEWQDFDGNPHRWAMPAELMGGDSVNVVGELLRRGLHITSGKKNKVIEYIQSVAPFERVICTDKTGWHGAEYVTPDHVYGDNAGKYIYQSPTGMQSSFAKSGSLEEWREQVAAYAVGNSRMAFAISTAFAGSLIDLVSIESGGFHFSGGSKDGKTTVQLMAGSVFGHPDHYKKTWRATSNGLESVATLHNDGFLILDEIKQCSPKEAGEVAYMLANGQDKIRSKDKGGIRDSKTWRLLFLSSGEMSLVEYLKMAGIQSFAGQEVRLANIESDAGKGHKILEKLHGFKSLSEFFTHINEAMRKYYGTAGEEWLNTITRQREELQQQIHSKLKTFVDAVMPENASSQVDVVAKRFALVAVAGELATQNGITGWEEGEATRAAKQCFKDWLNDFGTGDREEKRMIDQAMGFLERNASLFQNMNVEKSMTYAIADRVGFFRKSSDFEGYEYIVPARQMERVAEGYNVKQVVKALQDRGLINLPDKAGKSAIVVNIPGQGRKRCYIITPTEEHLKSSESGL